MRSALKLMRLLSKTHYLQETYIYLTGKITKYKLIYHKSYDEYAINYLRWSVYFNKFVL